MTDALAVPKTGSNAPKMAYRTEPSFATKSRQSAHHAVEDVHSQGVHAEDHPRARPAAFPAVAVDEPVTGPNVMWARPAVSRV